jgi:hypothetical protein
MLALPEREDKKNIHQTTARRILRKIYGIAKENDIWNSRFTHDL